jgi:alpha-2-macroglobulin
MKPLLRLFLLLLVSACLYSCANKNGLTIKKGFDDEIATFQNLEFSFDKDIFPDSLLHNWDTTHYIDFTPEVKGSFKWNSSSELTFSPANGFLPGTEYTALVTKRVLNKSRKKYSLGNATFKFHTAPLRIENTRVFWTRSQSMNNVVVQADFDFNYEVKIPEAVSKFKLSSGGSGIVTTSINGGTGKTVSLQFASVNELDKEIPLQVDVLKDIPLANGNIITQHDTIIRTIIPSRYTLMVTGIVAQHTGTEGIITVSTSQPVLEEQLKESITIEPSVAFDVAISDGGLIITSTQLKAEQTYELTISKKMEGAFGGKLRTDYTEQVRFGKLDPSIQFVNAEGMYLSSKGYKNLALNIVNVPEVEVQVIKVYENNLEFFMRSGLHYNYEYDEETDEYGSYRYYNTENLGDTVFQATYKTSALPRLNSASVLHLDFSDKIKGYDGVYVVTVASKEHKWIQHSKILSISDIGLIVKEGDNNMYVFANSIKTATPLSNVKISFISSTNQRLYTASTDNEGTAVFKDISKNSPGFHVAMVTAKMNEEFSFVWLSKSRVETSRFDVGGRMPNKTNLNAMVYAERNLYRPGETINASAVLRDERWNTPGEIPVKMKLLMPNGKEFANHKKILNAEGSCETSFKLPPTAITGTYMLEVHTGNDILLNSYNISVEDFMPDRLKVQLKTNKPEYAPGDSVKATVQADNLFGTPAAGRYYECMLNLKKVDFATNKFPDYYFGIKNDINVDFNLEKGKTAANGSASASFELPDDIAYTGLLKGNVMCAVSDETGRPVHRYENITVYTQRSFIGIRNMEEYVSTRRSLKVMLVAVDKNGNAQNNVKARVVLVKKEWHTVIQQEGSRYRYVSQSDEKVLSSRDINISGTATTYTVVPELSGEYELRISLAGTRNFVSQRFYAYGGWDTQYTSFEVNNEGNVTIKPDKDKYQPGEDVDILFTTPFEGRMLVTVERNSLMEHYYLNTQNKSAALTLKANDAFVPNVYVTATLFRPMDASDMPLVVAHGFRSVQVENAKYHLPVNVSLSEKSRSKTKQTITVKTAPGAYVTIAAVDEGILQVRNYETPDPYRYFYQKVALATNSYDIYPLLLPEIKTTRSSTGGDGGSETEMRVNPLFVNRVKNVSYWSGILQANNEGIVKYSIDIPQFSGDLRVMAVAYKGKAFGGADQHMKVADPIIISTALPRFLSPEDEVIMPVTLSNTTAKDVEVSVATTVSGPLSIQGDAGQRIRIKANSEQRAVFRIAAAQAIGAGRVVVTVKGMNETFTNETDISIRPPASAQFVYAAGQADETKLTTIDLQNDFMPGTLRGKLLVSASPLARFTKNLSSLVHYPYGCVEQTTSAAFPQLYYHDLVKAMEGNEGADMNPAYNVQQAIMKLQSMQLYNGALSYWPDGGSESWWGSVYATHFLLEARKAGYDVNTKTIDRLLQYQKQQLNRHATEIFYYNENLKKEIAAKEIAYSLYVLAIAGQPQQSVMNYYKAHQDMLSLDSKYMLAAAYAASGQHDKARQVLPPSFSGEKAKQVTGGSFYSYIRDQALALNALLEIDPDNAQVGTLARQLSEQLMKERYLNTQENVFSLLAFGKIARSANKTNATAQVLSNGKVIANTTGADININLATVRDNQLQIKMKGKGNYYYFAEVSGISATGKYKEEDSYLKVRRGYYDRDGKLVTNNTFKQNDLIIVKLTLEAQYNGNIDNVVVTDMLPAGFEIENARLSTLPEIKWVSNGDEPDYMDIRDDRINMFTSVGSKVKTFYYMVRAVSPGTFQAGPVQADAMYNGAYHSYNGAAEIKVLEN